MWASSSDEGQQNIAHTLDISRSGAAPYPNQAWTHSTPQKQRPHHVKSQLNFPFLARELAPQKSCDWQSANLMLGKSLPPLQRFLLPALVFELVINGCLT